MVSYDEQLTTAISMQVRVELVERGMQQSDLGAAVGVGAAAINRYLQGHRTIPMPTFIAVAETFGMKPSELLGRAEARVHCREEELDRGSGLAPLVGPSEVQDTVPNRSPTATSGAIDR